MFNLTVDVWSFNIVDAENSYTLNVYQKAQASFCSENYHSVVSWFQKMTFEDLVCPYIHWSGHSRSSLGKRFMEA